MYEHIKEYADSPADLIRSDIFNVLEGAHEEHREKLSVWLKEQRPDLADEIDDCMRNIRADELADDFGGMSKPSERVHRPSGGEREPDYE